MRHRRPVVAVAIVAAGASVGVAAPAGATGSSSTVVIGPVQSIQRAVDAARPGMRIVLRPGTYRQTVTIAKDGITLQGSGSGRGGTLLAPPRTLPNDLCRQVSGGSGVCVLGWLDLNLRFNLCDR